METTNEKQYIGVFGAAFLGIGAMVGAGIFALLGEAGAVAGTAVWLSFLIAGAIAALQGYSFSKLGTKYPSRGGTIEYLLQGFGNGHLTGVVSWLFYLVGLIVISMVATSFGSYASELFFGDDVPQETAKLLALVIVVVMALLNIEANRASVARVQTAIVWTVIVLLGGFSFITIRNADWSLLSPDDYPAFSSILSSVALTFFAFLGFSVVAFSAGDMKNPEKDLSKAMYLSLGLTTALYVSIALGVFGMLTLDEVIASGDTAIAAAAEPILGNAGFVIMTIAACFSTSSAVNSNYFASTGLVTYLANIGQFPSIMGNQVGNNGNIGTVVSTIIVAIFTLLFDLSQIASVGSAVALIIFMMIGFAHIRLVDVTGAKLPIIYVGILSVAITLIVFAVVTLADEPKTAVTLVVLLVLAVCVDRFWRAIPFLKAEEASTGVAPDLPPATSQ